MAKFSVELGAMFNEIASKIGEALKSGYKTIDEKTEQIKQLREDIRNERTEIGTVKMAVVAFATTATQVINGHKQDDDNVDNLIDVLDDIEGCVDREVGTCANCGTLLMESDEPYYEDDKVFCDDNCADEYHMIGECEWCGSPIYDTDNYVEDAVGLFCNDECCDEFFAELESAEDDTEENTEENTEADSSDEGDEPEEIYND